MTAVYIEKECQMTFSTRSRMSTVSQGRRGARLAGSAADQNIRPDTEISYACS